MPVGVRHHEEWRNVLNQSFWQEEVECAKQVIAEHEMKLSGKLLLDFIKKRYHQQAIGMRHFALSAMGTQTVTGITHPSVAAQWCAAGIARRC